jgi:hypothetical protein
VNLRSALVSLAQDAAVVFDALFGHPWTVDPGQYLNGRFYGPWKVCHRCKTMRLLTAADYPESTTRDLSSFEEEVLAEIDRIEFPDGYSTTAEALTAQPIDNYEYTEDQP